MFVLLEIPRPNDLFVFVTAGEPEDGFSVARALPAAPLAFILDTRVRVSFV